MSLQQEKCPGQSSLFWKPEDVTEKPCPDCGYLVEFFKTDIKRKCPQCSREMINPKANLSCAEWCNHAEDCLGPDIYKKLAGKRELDEKRAKDFGRLIELIPQDDSDVIKLFNRLFAENTDPGSLFDIKSLRYVSEKDPDLAERAMGYFRQFTG